MSISASAFCTDSLQRGGLDDISRAIGRSRYGPRPSTPRATAEGALLGVAAGRSAVLDHLFGDRLAATDLLRTGGPRSVFANVPVYVDLLALPIRIGVNIVDGDEDHEFMDSLR
jgi:hypothetical protein